MLKVGFQGVNGSFSQLATMRYFKGKEYAESGYKNFIDIMEDLEKHELDYAVLPVENTTTGIIARTYDLFKYYHIHAVGEILVPIRQDLIGIPGTQISELKEVYSHPEALSQCQRFFQEHPQIKQVPWQDTAKAVEYVKECGDMTKAALGSHHAAEYYDMSILQQSVQDLKSNMTRFLIITWHDETVSDADKTSLMLICKHEPGSLFKALQTLGDRNINMIKLESRPIPNRVFEYLFYVDIQGAQQDPEIHAALQEMKQHCVELRSFGSYKAAKIE